jgi:transcriptional regulator
MNTKTSLETLILAVLSEEPKHGYEISKAIRKRSNDILQPSEGQLYPALHKLEAEGCIAAEWLIQEGKPNRKVYSITPIGTAKLEKNRSDWNKHVEGISSVLSCKPVMGESNV